MAKKPFKIKKILIIILGILVIGQALYIFRKPIGLPEFFKNIKHSIAALFSSSREYNPEMKEWLILDDNFENNQSGWRLQKGKFILEEGKYLLNLKEEGISALLIPVRDGKVEVDARWMSGDPNTFYGLAIRSRIGKDYISFSVNSEGHYRLLGPNQALITQEKTPHFISKKTNRLGIEFVGKLITGYLNGKRLFSIYQETNHAGGFGVYQSGKSMIEFDNLFAWDYRKDNKNNVSGKVLFQGQIQKNTPIHIYRIIKLNEKKAVVSDELKSNIDGEYSLVLKPGNIYAVKAENKTENSKAFRLIDLTLEHSVADFNLELKKPVQTPVGQEEPEYQITSDVKKYSENWKDKIKDLIEELADLNAKESPDEAKKLQLALANARSQYRIYQIAQTSTINKWELIKPKGQWKTDLAKKIADKVWLLHKNIILDKIKEQWITLIQAFIQSNIASELDKKINQNFGFKCLTLNNHLINQYILPLIDVNILKKESEKYVNNHIDWLKSAFLKKVAQNLWIEGRPNLKALLNKTQKLSPALKKISTDFALKVSSDLNDVISRADFSMESAQKLFPIYQGQDNIEKKLSPIFKTVALYKKYEKAIDCPKAFAIFQGKLELDEAIKTQLEKETSESQNLKKELNAKQNTTIEKKSNGVQTTISKPSIIKDLKLPPNCKTIEKKFQSGKLSSRVSTCPGRGKFGPIEFWYDNGQKASVAFIVGTRKYHGYYAAWNRKGIKVIEGYYLHGKRIGKWLEYSDLGDKAREYNYNKEGQLHGPYIEWHSMIQHGKKTDFYGKIKTKGEYFNGKREGTWYFLSWVDASQNKEGEKKVYRNGTLVE